MKAYGHKRKEVGTCPYGCCYASKSGKELNCRKLVDKSRRKRARQDAIKEVSNEILRDAL